MPAARWTETAVDLSETPAKVAEYLGLEDLCRAVKLSPATVTDSLLRPPITDPHNPRGAICRPHARVGGILHPTPFWSIQQRDEYLRRKANRPAARRARRAAQADLPEITPPMAAQRGLALVDEIAARLEIAENTVRRFARDYGTFPAVRAIAPREGARHFGPAKEYRDFADVRDWIIAYQAEADDETETVDDVAVPA